MSYVPLSFFSRVVKPGDSIEVELDEFSALVTGVTFGESVKGDKRSVLSLTYLDRMAEPDEEILAAAAEGKSGKKDDGDEDDSDVSFDTGAVMRKTVIASLIPGKIENAAINVVLNSNEAYELSVSGDNEVHLTGQYVLYPNDGPEQESDSEDEDEYDSELASDEFGEYDPEAGMLGGEITGLADSDDDDEDSDDDLEEDDSRFEELRDESPKKASAAKALAKAEKQEAAKAVKAAQKSESAAAAEDVSMDAGDASILSADTSKLSKNQKKKLKKLEKQQGETKAPEAAAPAAAEPKKAAPAAEKPAPAAAETKKPSKKQTLPSGLVIEDAKVGKGASAKNGQKLSMRYIGKLSNGKVFDQNTKGQPFTFKLGAGEVIKGWDEGLKGMAAGGERKLTIPAALAYGKKGVDGIPGGATLSFDVKLLSIK